MSPDYKTNNLSNDAWGSIYQEEVANYFKELTGETPIIRDTHGVDVICGEYYLEVKGTRQLFIENKVRTEKRIFKTIRGWKTRPVDCPDAITHFVFVLDDKNLSSKPIIYVVDIVHIRERFRQYPDAKVIWFPLHWVFDHYNFDLSRIP